MGQGLKLGLVVAIGFAIGVAFIHEPAIDGQLDWLTANAVTHGYSPQTPTPELAAMFGMESPLGGVNPRTPGAILLLLPYALVPMGLASYVSRLVVILAALWLWRTLRPGPLGTILILFPGLLAVYLGNLSMLVAAFVAIALVEGSAFGLAAATTLRLWPWSLGLALLSAGHWKQAAKAATWFVGLNLIGLSLPGVSLAGTIRVFEGAYVRWHGMPHPVWLAAVGLAVVLVVVRRHPRWLTLSVAPSLFLSPVVWVHYFTVLAVPASEPPVRGEREAVPSGVWLARTLRFATLVRGAWFPSGHLLPGGEPGALENSSSQAQSFRMARSRADEDERHGRIV